MSLCVGAAAASPPSVRAMVAEAVAGPLEAWSCSATTAGGAAKKNSRKIVTVGLRNMSGTFVQRCGSVKVAALVYQYPQQNCHLFLW